MSLRSMAVLLLLLLLPSCASPEDHFEMQAIDSFGREIPCLLVVNGDQAKAREDKVFVHGRSRVSLDFASPLEGLQLTLEPTVLDEEGTPELPASDRPSIYQNAQRELFAYDYRVQVFMLQRAGDR